MSCGSCLFVVVLSVCLWLDFPPPLIFASSNLNPPPTPRSTPAWFCTPCCHFDGCFRFFCCVCHRFAPSLLTSNTWSAGFCAEHLYTHYNNLSKYGVFQSFSQYGLFQNPGLHTCFGLNSNRGLNKTNVFTSKPSFTQRAVLHKNCVIHKHNVLTQKPCSCWRAVCSLQDSSCPGGRRNTPKAVKYMGVIP